MKTPILFLFLLSGFIAQQVSAQDDLMKMALENTDSTKSKIISTFKTTKLISAQTNETVHKRTLDFRIGHLFGNVGEESNGGYHTLYGLDASNDIRISFEYGITDRLTVGVSRCKRLENLEGLVKYRIFEQTTDNKMPLAVTVFANSAISTVENRENAVYPKTVDRLSYTLQLILARKFSSHFSFELLPTLVHRNYVFDANDNNDILALGAGGRLKITRSTSLVADYFYNFDPLRKPNNGYWYNPLGIGFEIETGGHVFTIMFTNAVGILENDFIPNTTDTWSKAGFKFSFNISRNFRL
ncbi:MAG: DUF5777 family beta-barrel protein [Bacteroidia bacterium]